MPGSSGSLLIAVKAEAKKRLPTTAVLFYILQNNCLNKSRIFSEDLV